MLLAFNRVTLIFGVTLDFATIPHMAFSAAGIANIQPRASIP